MTACEGNVYIINIVIMRKARETNLKLKPYKDRSTLGEKREFTLK